MLSLYLNLFFFNPSGILITFWMEIILKKTRVKNLKLMLLNNLRFKRRMWVAFWLTLTALTHPHGKFSSGQ